MEMARALTKRVKRTDLSIGRVGSVRNHISSPVALISTTNMLSYNAPDIRSIKSTNANTDATPSTAPSTPTRTSIEVDSDASTPSNASTTATSVESSPSSDRGTLLSYPRKTSSASIVPSIIEVDDTPVLPKRALSHSKREHERLSRQRSIRLSWSTSVQSSTGFSLNRITLHDASASMILVAPTETSNNPFSRELEQLNEIAEEFGATARDVAAEEDLAFLHSKGLAAFDACEYIEEICPLWECAFVDKLLEDA